ALLMISGAWLYFWYVGPDVASPVLYTTMVVATSVVTVLGLELTDNYQIAALRRPLGSLTTILLVWGGILALMTMAGFFLKISSEFSRFWLGSWFVLGFAMIFVVRVVLARMIRRWARNGMMERRAV